MEVYLDNNSTTQIDPRVEDLFVNNIKFFSNVNVPHNKGSETRELLNDAYDTLYDGIGAENSDDIIINSSAEEGNNTVIKTFLHEFIKNSKKNHIISTNSENQSTKASLEYCESMGMHVTYISTDKNGLVKINELEEAITDNTCLISILLASSEIGAVQDIKAISQIAKNNGVFLHCDGEQSIGKIEVDMTDLNVDYFTFSAHKFHGPKGIGALYVKNSAPYNALIHGEKDIMAGKRAGSLYNYGITAMASALEIANINLSYFETTTQKLRNKLEDELLKIKDSKSFIPRENRLKNLLIISFKGVKDDSLLWDMNKHGIYISTSSKYLNSKSESSLIIDVLNQNKEIANTTVMFALSKFTTEEEIDYVIEKVKSSVQRIREISTTYAKQKALI